MNIIFEWIDLIWVVIALLVVRKGQRFWALFFIFSGILMLRLQVELFETIGYPQGLLPFLDYGVFIRGLCVYNLFYAGYLILAFFSPGDRGPFFMVASISAIFAVLMASTFVMVL